MPLTRIRQTAIGADAITTPKLDDTAGGLTLPGTQYVHVPVGTTAQRPSSPANGHLRYNTNFQRLEQYANGQWQSIDTPPSITSLSYSSPLTAADPAGGETITLTGTNFQAGATVTVGGTSATSVSIVSSTSITFTTPAKTAGDYDVVVTNSNGLAATLLNGISYNGTPAFTTAAGNVGSITEDVAMSTITIVAAEPDGGTLAYSVTSGALPTGVSLGSANGQLTGTPNVNPAANTTFNFTVTATDNENQTNSRAFNLIVLRPIYLTSLDDSLRFNDDDSAYLSRTPSSAGNRKTWTWSAWVKRGNIGTRQILFSADNQASNATYMALEFQADDNFRALGGTEGGSSQITKETTMVFRDPAAWYHLVFVMDATNTVARLYVNGDEITDWNTNNNPTNQDYQINAATQHFMGRFGSSLGTSYFDGYLSDVHFIDGQALNPTSFAEEYYGVWVPKAYSGSYGTNGFHLDFDDTNPVGNDTSGNNNDWTSNNFGYSSVTGSSGLTGVQKLFDGGITTPAATVTASTDNFIQWTAPTGISYSSSVEVYVYAANGYNITNTYSFNGGTETSFVGGGSNFNGFAYITVASGSGTLNSIKIRLQRSGSNSAVGWAAIRVDGTILTGESYLGVSNDQVIDSPTNNWAVWSPPSADSSAQFKEGNLEAAAADNRSIKATFSMPTGKWYWENRMVSGQPFVGICPETMSDSISPNSSSYQTVQYYFDGRVFINSVSQGNIGSYTTGDIIGATFDASIHQLTFYKNNTQVGQYTAPDTSLIYSPLLAAGSTNAFIQTNFGQDSTFAGNRTAGSNADGNGLGEFAYAPPSGFLALCAKNLPESAIDTSIDDRPEDYFNTVLTSGDGSNATVSGFGFQPDFIWHKSRTSTNNNQLMDSLRVDGSGGSYPLVSNSTNAEGGTAAATLNSDGFVHLNGSSNNFNGNGNNYVSWGWKAGGAPTATNSAGAGAVPTSGSVMIDGVASTSALAGTIPATKISANTKAGFSIISWTGSGADGTIGHGLTKTPEFFMTKDRNNSRNWEGFHKDLTTGYVIYLNLTNGQNNAGSTYFQGGYSAAGTNNTTIALSLYLAQTSKPMIGYAFHSVEGYSKVSSYVGNGSANGQFINLGFKPAWLLIKKSSGTDGWSIYDNAREPINVVDTRLATSSNAIEVTGSNISLDFSSNGFKLRGTGSTINTSGQTYIYLAFAEDPLKYAEAR